MRNFTGSVAAYAKTLTRCFYDASFYRALRHKPLKEAFGHLAILLILVWMVPFIVVFFLGVRQGFGTLKDILHEHVPPGTVFALHEGVFTNTMPKPIVLRQENSAFILNASNTELFLADEKIGIVISATSIAHRSESGDIETVGFGSIRDFETSRADIDEWLAGGVRWTVLIVSLLVVSAISLGLVIWHLTGLAIHAFILWGLLRVFKKPMPYRSVVVMAAYAMSLPIFLAATFFWFGFKMSIAPIVVLYWILLAVIFHDNIREEVSPPKAEKHLE